MEFTYTAIDTTGKQTKGVIDTTSEKDVIDYLRQSGLTPVHVSRKTKYNFSSFGLLNGLRNSDIVFFTRQLSSMVLTGITLLEALNILKKQSTKPAMVKMLDNIIATVSEGKSFSEALSVYPKQFGPVYIALIKAAESSGLLDKVLQRLAENMEKSEDLKKKITSAMFYPAIVIAGVIGVVVLMNVVVIPQLGALYEQMELELPLPTQIVLATSKLFTNYMPVGIFLVIAGIVGYKKFSVTETGKKTIDKLKLKAPVLGSIITLSILDEVSRTLSLLISAGTSIIEALNITANVSGNVWYHDAILRASKMVEKGIPLSRALEDQQIFPLTLVQMVRVGETTGRIDDGLAKVSAYFERDLDLKVKNLTTALEPIIIVFLGSVVGFIILAIITPIYSLVTSF